MDLIVSCFSAVYLGYSIYLFFTLLTAMIVLLPKSVNMDMGVMQIWAPCIWIKMILKPVLVLVLLVQSVLAHLCIFVLCPFFSFAVSYGQIQAKVDYLEDKLPTKYIADFVCMLYDFFDRKENELYVMAMEAG